MKRLVAILLMLLVIPGADAATRGQSATVSRGNDASSSTATRATAARAATTARSAAVPQTSARAATSGRATVSRTSAATSSTSTVAARAATTQKVLNAGTSVQAANENTVIQNQCREKYYGCMDSFCMLDNENGGRCICSDKNAEYDQILADIERLDQQSYQMATVGVESIESGFDATAAISSVVKDDSGVDLSLWDAYTVMDDLDSGSANPLSGKEGDALFNASHQLCAQQMPECNEQLSMLSLMYRQQIRSDCTAYENSLNQQKQASQQKLAAAQTALRQASYEQLQAANKYDLGQCTVEFKNCMITTGGCGDDFAGCATVAAFDATNTRGRGVGARPYVIKGDKTDIEISASTYDILYSKKPLCDGITQQCVAVADQVWDTFLREAAPQIKNAELIAEDNARQNCIGNISSCFQQACRDTMDPNDPDGSYDMCLTRPETMLNLCTVPLNACGISTTSAAEAEASPIWEFVVARLASMRVNSCTTQFKECLQSEDRCGSDYTQCVGLDTDTIVRMCPYDALPGCQQVYGSNEIRDDAVYDELYEFAQGIFLGIDNNMLEYCQSALDEAVIEVCGSTDSCDQYMLNQDVGTRSLDYKICDIQVIDGTDIAYSNCRTTASQITDVELGRNATGQISPLGGVITGTIYWDSVDVDSNGNITPVDEYFVNADLTDASDSEKEMVALELGALQTNIDMVFGMIESDPTVQFCMSGREVQGIKPYSGETKPRFPELTKQVRMQIATSALNAARDNYYQRYDELNEQMSKDNIEIAERIAAVSGENAKDVRREAARQACVNLADMSGMPKSETPKSLVGTIIAAAVIATSAVLITVFSAGIGGLVGLAATVTAKSAIVAAAPIVYVAAGSAGLGAVSGWIQGAATADYSGAQVTNEVKDLTGYFENKQWNYEETITTEFNMDTLVCHKCVKSRQCAKIKTPLFGSKSCKQWEEPIEVCSDIEF